MARVGVTGATFTNLMRDPMPKLDEKRQAANLRSRALHEQRRAAGRCDRCAKKTTGRYWYCFDCRLAHAQAKAARKLQQHASAVVHGPQSSESPSMGLS